MRKQFLLGCFIVLLNCVVCNAQEGKREPTTLPGAFSVFSEHDVLSLIFEGYNPKTGQTSSIPDSETDKSPSDVSIIESKLWRANGTEYLIVLTDLGNSPVSMCGNCASYTPLAVLKREVDKLILVAKQDLPKTSDITDPGSFGSGPFDASWYGGHDFMSLDLAPYRLNKNEILIGVRIEHMWMPAQFYRTRLVLYRIEGTRLREVFNELVIDREYRNHLTDDPVITKTTSTFSATAVGQRFFDLVITKSTVRVSTRTIATRIVPVSAI